MRRLWACLVIIVGMPVVAMCGGTSSETPWPVEPLDREPGPEGETRRGDDEIDTSKLPDRYSKDGGAGGEPEEDPEAETPEEEHDEPE
jgi:hypothetical protein